MVNKHSYSTQIKKYPDHSHLKLNLGGQVKQGTYHKNIFIFNYKTIV